MNHDEELSEYLDGRLDAAGRRRVEALLAADPALERRLRLLTAMRSALRAEARPAPAGLKTRLKEAAERSAERPGWLSLLKEALAPRPWALAAAGAAAVVVLALNRERPAAPPAPAPVAVVVPAAPVLTPDLTAASAKLGAELWTDDDGGDHDEA